VITRGAVWEPAFVDRIVTSHLVGQASISRLWRATAP